MLAELTKDETLIAKAIEQLEKYGFKNIKADIEGHETPSKLTRQQDDFEFTPDITATMHGRTYYFEVAQKTDKSRRLVTKWKLLAYLANMKQTGLKIFVPHGTMKFTRELVRNHEIEADLEKL